MIHGEIRYLIMYMGETYGNVVQFVNLSVLWVLGII